MGNRAKQKAQLTRKPGLFNASEVPFFDPPSYYHVVCEQKRQFSTSLSASFVRTPMCLTAGNSLTTQIPRQVTHDNPSFKISFVPVANQGHQVLVSPGNALVPLFDWQYSAPGGGDLLDQSRGPRVMLPPLSPHPRVCRTHL